MSISSFHWPWLSGQGALAFWKPWHYITSLENPFWYEPGVHMAQSCNVLSLTKSSHQIFLYGPMRCTASVPTFPRQFSCSFEPPLFLTSQVSASQSFPILCLQCFIQNLSEKSNFLTPLLPSVPCTDSLLFPSILLPQAWVFLFLMCNHHLIVSFPMSTTTFILHCKSQTVGWGCQHQGQRSLALVYGHRLGQPISTSFNISSLLSHLMQLLNTQQAMFIDQHDNEFKWS